MYYWKYIQYSNTSYCSKPGKLIIYSIEVQQTIICINVNIKTKAILSISQMAHLSQAVNPNQIWQQQIRCMNTFEK